MLRAVRLDNEMPLDTCEVYDECLDHDLPAKLDPVEAPIAQHRP